MNLIKKMRIVLVLLIVSVFSSCKKEDETTSSSYTYYKIKQSLYPFLFDYGSFWIYKDTITGNIDSISLTSITKHNVTIKPIVPTQGPQGEQEYFNIQYLSFPSNQIIEEQLMSDFISRGLINGGFTLLSSKTKGDKRLNAEITEILNSLKVEETTYYNVVKMKISKDNYIKNYCFYYYVDSIGIIKKEITSNNKVVNTSNLMRYKTNLYKYQ